MPKKGFWESSLGLLGAAALNYKKKEGEGMSDFKEGDKVLVEAVVGYSIGGVKYDGTTKNIPIVLKETYFDSTRDIGTHASIEYIHPYHYFAGRWVNLRNEKVWCAGKTKDDGCHIVQKENGVVLVVKTDRLTLWKEKEPQTIRLTAQDGRVYEVKRDALKEVNKDE